jgi:hypothetical protein
MREIERIPADRRRGLRSALFATVSAAAILAIEPASADPLFDPNGWWTSAQGEYLFASGSSQPLFMGLGGGNGIGNQYDHVRDAGAFELSGGGSFAFDPAWDFRLAFTGLRSIRHSKNASGATNTFTGPSLSFARDRQTLNTDISQSFDIGDFDIGRDFGLGDASLRAFAGLRFAWFDQSTSVAYNFFTLAGLNTTAIAKGDSNSWGIGPRVGISGSYPLTDLGYGKLSLTGEVAAALLFGDADRKLSGSAAGSGGSASSVFKSNSGQTIYNLDGKLGLSFAFPLQGTEASLTVGYMVTSWWNIINTQGVLGPSIPLDIVPTTTTKSGSQLYQGPFVNFTVKF